MVLLVEIKLYLKKDSNIFAANQSIHGLMVNLNTRCDVFYMNRSLIIKELFWNSAFNHLAELLDYAVSARGDYKEIEIILEEDADVETLRVEILRMKNLVRVGNVSINISNRKITISNISGSNVLCDLMTIINCTKTKKERQTDR